MAGAAGGAVPALEKHLFRRAALARRAALPPAIRATAGAVAIEHLLASPEYRRAALVLAFAGFGDEIDTIPLLRAVLASGRRLGLPRVLPRRDCLSVHAVGSLDQLVPGRWGISEPDPGLPELDPGRADLLVVPGVAFDPAGRRLGYGRGYYDRLLGQVRASRRGQWPLACGLALECQVWPVVPAGPGDQQLDMLVTESGPRYFGPAGLGG